MPLTFLNKEISFFDLSLRKFRCLLLIFVVLPAWARLPPIEPLSDVSAHFDRLRGSLVSATVVLKNNNIVTAAPINEEMLLRGGCIFDSSDKGSISALVDIVANARIASQAQLPNNYKHGVNYRIGIYLTARDGSQHILLFQDRPIELPSLWGTYNRTTPVESTMPAFRTQVRKWTAGRIARPTNCSETGGSVTNE